MSNNQNNSQANSETSNAQLNVQALIEELNITSQDIEVAKHMVGENPDRIQKFLKSRQNKPVTPLW